MSETQTQEFDLNELFNMQSEAQARAEANAFRTLRAGDYRLTVEKAEGKVTGEQFSFGAGIKMVHLQLTAKSLNGAKDGVLFADITPVTLRNEKGLGRPTKLWAQYEKALGVEGKDAGTVLNAIKSYPVQGYVSEAFVAPDNTMHFYKTDEERQALVAAGYTPRNWIASVKAIKG